jgi:hypothetical protein
VISDRRVHEITMARDIQRLQREPVRQPILLSPRGTVSIHPTLDRDLYEILESALRGWAQKVEDGK